ncbi:DUF4174 domain-containing protein [Psychromarinibacter sp. S121]|uniref:DUF4174 domain-containing protein n=1 Tax=Psychromarinibacter sp. S121 TaxID=3415127 RepID=UPI003C799FB8
MPAFRTLLTPLAIALGATTLASAAAAQSSGPEIFRPLDPAVSDLNSYRWDKRVVLLFGAGEDDGTYTAARDQLAAVAPALEDRDIVVLTDTAPEQQGAIRQGLEVDGFAMVLVGKDGGVKINSAEPVSPDALFATIDAMPMRRREMSGG